MDKTIVSDLWPELFRPKRIQDAILPNSRKKFFLKIVKSEENIPNLLFHSPSPGTGKTSIAKAICLEKDLEFKFLNMSKDSGIDTLRDTIDRFATSKSMNGKGKVVILDEFDGSSMQLQKGLKTFIEQAPKHCRFIITCNSLKQIIQPLISRCQTVDFNINSKDMEEEMKPKIFSRLGGILKFKKVDYTDEALKDLIDMLYPDIRRMINTLQHYFNEFGIIDGNIVKHTSSNVGNEFFEFFEKADVTGLRKYINEKSLDFDMLYDTLFYEYLPKIPPQSRPDSIITIAEYMYRSPNVTNKEINFSACALELMKILKS